MGLRRRTRLVISLKVVMTQLDHLLGRPHPVGYGHVRVGRDHLHVFHGRLEVGRNPAKVAFFDEKTKPVSVLELLQRSQREGQNPGELLQIVLELLQMFAVRHSFQTSYAHMSSLFHKTRMEQIGNMLSHCRVCISATKHKTLGVNLEAIEDQGAGVVYSDSTRDRYLMISGIPLAPRYLLLRTHCARGKLCSKGRELSSYGSQISFYL